MLDQITNISGIKLHYARDTQYPYGTRGRPTTFSVERSFNRKLIQCFEELFDACPLGRPGIITCAGIFNPNHNNSHSTHRTGKAFDFDAAFWANHTLITKKFHHNKELYLGIECFLRKHFGIVLNYFYNQLHEDHWHFDDSVEVDFRTNYKSSILHIQLVLTYIYDDPVEIDGIWGPQTDNALKAALDRISLTGRITTITTYKAFLRKTGMIAFKRFELSTSPSTLLNNVYESIDHLDIGRGNRLQIAEALNDFRNHPSTQSWLKSTASEVDIDAIIDSI